MQKQNDELDESTATRHEQENDEDDEELNFEADIRQAYEEIIDNISTIRDTLRYFSQSKRSSLRGFSELELEKLQKDRSSSLTLEARVPFPASTSKLRSAHERKERSWSYNDALTYKAVRKKLQSKTTKTLIKSTNVKTQDKDKDDDDSTADCVVVKDENSAEQFTPKCEKMNNDNDAIAISRPKSSKNHSTNFKHLRRAFAILKLSEKDNTDENNNTEQGSSSNFESESKKDGLTFRTLKTKNDVLHVVKADV